MNMSNHKLIPSFSPEHTLGFLLPSQCQSLLLNSCDLVLSPYFSFAFILTGMGILLLFLSIVNTDSVTTQMQAL